MKTILVTGGAGFIGSHLCERLIRDPAVRRVVCVDNLDPSYPVAFKKENLALLKHRKFVFYKADIRNRPSLAKIIQKERPEAIVHIAAKTDTRDSLVKPRAYATTNYLGTLNLLECAKERGVAKFVFISSSSIYGNAKTKPPLAETETTDAPLAPYGATKKAGEVLAYSYFYNYGLAVTVLRLFNVYGERMRPGPVLSRWTALLLANKPVEMSGAGTRKRDFTYVGDVVDAILHALKRRSGYEIFNISASHPVPLTGLLATLEKAAGRTARVLRRPSNRASIEISHGDIRKARRLLHWRPKTTLAKGVSRYVAWFRAHRL